MGKTLAISWLPVAERARSTIIARRALDGDGMNCNLSQGPVQPSPFCWFTHSLDDPVKGFLAPFFQCFCDRLGALFVSGEFEKTLQEMVKGHAAMFFRTVFKNYEEVRRHSFRNRLIADVLCWIQYDPHWFLATSLKTAVPWFKSSSTIPSLASGSRFSNAC